MKNQSDVASYGRNFISCQLARGCPWTPTTLQRFVGPAQAGKYRNAKFQFGISILIKNIKRDTQIETFISIDITNKTRNNKGTKNVL